MNEILILSLSACAGGVLGLLFFGGLWWTLRIGLLSQRPAMWLLLSLMVRMSIAIYGFYLVGHGGWHRLVACLVGFVAGRVLVSWLTRLSPKAFHATHA